MKSLSITAQRSQAFLKKQQYQILHEAEVGSYPYSLLRMDHELILRLHLHNGLLLAIRLLELSDMWATIHTQQLETAKLNLSVETSIGSFALTIQLSDMEQLMVRYGLTYTPSAYVRFEGLKPEVMIFEGHSYEIPTVGTAHVVQKQLRSGACFLSFGSHHTGTLFYFQELSELNKYAEDTHQSLTDVVQAQWPEIGLSLPGSGDKELKKGTRYILSKGYLVIQTQPAKDVYQLSRQHIDALAQVYQYLDRPVIHVSPFPRYADYTLQSLARQHGCWQQVKEYAYLNAYLNDYPTPPEIMVQTAVLAPLFFYKKKYPSDRAEQVVKAILEGLGSFFDDTIKAFVRWIPSKAHHLDHAEEQKKPRVMDSWYLHHPLIQLSSLLQDQLGNKQLEKQYYSSIRFAIKVARHFKYHWPVFYDLDSFTVEKAETQPGAGGEKDVAGMYAYLMLRTYALSPKKIYLDEAKRAAKTLGRYGFDLLYQSNNTAYAAEALLELWTLTKDDKYLHLSELCLGNLVRNMAIWERNYGHAKAYPTFFQLFPLSDAPYAAVFEEQECIASFHRYLRAAQHSAAPISASLSTLLAEYIHYTSSRLAYYLPPLLPEDILATEVKTGYLSPQSWIPVEDIGDGWDAVGQVGQEVYGSGFLFQLVLYHYIPLDTEQDICFISYPFIELKREEKQVQIQLLGAPEYTCHIQLYRSQATYRVQVASGQSHTLSKTDKNLKIKAGQKITITWKR